jgi:hypothetical protein
MLLTSRNNMGSKILFKLVFINIVTGWAFFAVYAEMAGEKSAKIIGVIREERLLYYKETAKTIR